MASISNRSVTESIRDDFLTCHICFEVFTDPRILPCLHTYCFQCICSHVDTAQTEGRPVVCPECREPITDTVTSLKTNFFINGLTEVVKVKSNESLDCTACNFKGTVSKAKVKCLDCGDYLCSSCCDGHNASSLTWKHEKIPLDDIKQGSYDEKLRQLQKIKCLKHEDKDVEYYCESCSQTVCLACVLIIHRDHKFQTVPDAIKQRKDSIISLTGNIRENISNLNKKESDVLSGLDSTKAEREAAIAVIEAKAEDQIAKIIAKKNDAIKKVATESMLTEKVQEHELEEIRLQKGVVGSCINFCDNILEKGRDEEILMLEQMITGRLGQLQDKTDASQTETGQRDDLVKEDQKNAMDPTKKITERLGQLQDKTDAYQAEPDQRDGLVKEEQKETVDRKTKPKRKRKKKLEQVQDSDANKIRHSVLSKDFENKEQDKKNVPSTDDAKKVEDNMSSCINESASVTEMLEKFKHAHGATAALHASDTENVNLKLSKIFIVQHQDDTMTPEIKGIAFSSQIGLVLSDKANGSVKIYTSEGVFKNRITMDNFVPYSVAIAGNIIGVISENYLHLFKATGQKVNKILIHTKKPIANLPFTYSLAASGEEFIVGNIPDESKMRVYNLNGTVKKLISCFIHYPLKSLSLTNSGHFLLCEWGGGCVRIVSIQGNVKTKCRRTLQWKPNDACVSMDEIIFVADYDIGGICVFDKTGKLLLEHSTTTDGVKPTGVVLDDKGRLFVAGRIGYVSVYDIEH